MYGCPPFWAVSSLSNVMFGGNCQAGYEERAKLDRVLDVLVLDSQSPEKPPTMKRSNSVKSFCSEASAPSSELAMVPVGAPVFAESPEAKVDDAPASDNFAALHRLLADECGTQALPVHLTGYVLFDM